MNDTLSTILIALGTSSATGFAGWIFGRRRSVAETQGVELENVGKAVEIWRESAENLAEQLKVYSEQVRINNEQLVTLKQENVRLNEEINQLRSELDKLSKENIKLRSIIKAIKK